VTFYGMVVLAALGMGFATIAVADLAFQLRVTPRSAFLAAANMGALVSAMILSADLLAFGLAVAGLALAGRRRIAPAVAAFALAGLTKEVYLLVAFSTAVVEWRTDRRGVAMAVALVPVTPVALWSAYVMAIVPSMPTRVPLFDLPMVELFRSVSQWIAHHGSNRVELLLAAYVAVSFLGAAVALLKGRNEALMTCLAPWVLLALSSTGIATWDIPSNVARQFPIVWPLTILLLAAPHREHRLAN
jgi:hypothetical protein